MIHTIRPTGFIARETLFGSEKEEGLVTEFLRLTTPPEPITPDLEQASRAAELILRTMRTWVSSRHLCEAAPRHIVTTITRAEIDAALKEQAS